MKAHFDSQCPACNALIEAGDKIARSKKHNNEYTHRDCAVRGIVNQNGAIVIRGQGAVCGRCDIPLKEGDRSYHDSELGEFVHAR
jgi:hypothetical protein